MKYLIFVLASIFFATNVFIYSICSHQTNLGCGALLFGIGAIVLYLNTYRDRYRISVSRKNGTRYSEYYDTLTEVNTREQQLKDSVLSVTFSKNSRITRGRWLAEKLGLIKKGLVVLFIFSYFSTNAQIPVQSARIKFNGPSGAVIKIFDKTTVNRNLTAKVTYDIPTGTIYFMGNNAAYRITVYSVNRIWEFTPDSLKDFGLVVLDNDYVVISLLSDTKATSK